MNKTSTKVDLRFHLESATWLTPEVKSVLADKMGSDLTKDGWIVVKSDRTRSQSLNQADALEKLRASIREALQPPKPKFTAEQEESIRKGKLKASRSVNNTDQIAICNNQTERKRNAHARYDSLQALRLRAFSDLNISGRDFTQKGFAVTPKRAEEGLNQIDHTMFTFRT